MLWHVHIFNYFLVENSVHDNVRSQLSNFMFGLKGNWTKTIILTDTKDREHKTRKLQDKVIQQHCILCS